MGNLHLLSLQIDPLDIALKEVNLAKKLPDGINNVRHIQVACGDFVKHRSEEKEIVVVDQRDVDVRVTRNLPFHFDRGVQSAESAPEDHNAFFHKHAYSSSSATSQKILIAPLAFKSLSKRSL